MVEDSPARTPFGPRYIFLVAEDDADSADCLVEMLRMPGSEVLLARDGRQAVTMADFFHPDFIVLDIGMPVLDGYEACKEIRAQAWAKSAVVVALTGWDREEDKRRSAEAGFDHHIVKPIDREALERLFGLATPAKLVKDLVKGGTA